MIEETPDETGGGPPEDGEDFGRKTRAHRNTQATRRLAEDIRRRSEEIRNEAERIRSLSIITQINVEMNFRTAQQAYHSVMQVSRDDD